MVGTRRQIKSANDNEVPINAPVLSPSIRKSLRHLSNPSLNSNLNPPLTTTNKKLMEENKRLKETVKDLQNFLSLAKKEKEEVEKKYENISKLVEVMKEDRRLTGLDAVTIFPEEIWMIIFDQVKDWKDLLQLSKTCLLFHKLLHPSKTTFLFSQIFPLLWKEQTGSEILKCRSVCATWRKGIDQFLENRPCLRPHNGRRCKAQDLLFLNPMKIKGLDLGNTFDSTTVERWAAQNEILQGWTVGDYQNPSPFIGRALSIKFTPKDDPTDLAFFKALTNFLTAVGKHIWYISVHLEREPGPLAISHVEQFLTSNLRYSVPGLRKLRLFGNLGGYPMPNVKSIIWRSIFLETLEFERASTFYLDGRGMAPHPMIDGFLTQQHTHLKKLHVDIAAWSRLYKLGWPNLVELQVTDFTDEDGTEEFEYTLAGLETPKLKKLGVKADTWELQFCDRFNLYYPRDLHKMLDIVSSQESYKQLECLRMRGKFNTEEWGEWELEENPPPRQYRSMQASLKTLELEYNPRSCYSFLRRFGFLEKLTLVWNEEDFKNLDWSYITEFTTPPQYQPIHVEEDEDDDNDDAEFKVELNEFVASGQIYKSNVWKLLPYLKVLTVQLEIYTREGYEKYTKQENENKKVFDARLHI